jgi:predicted enzyme related to lactoylglutathione lyase
MSGFVRSLVTSVAIGAVVLSAPLVAQRGQGPAAPAAPVANAAPAGDVIGIGTFIHSVADANRSIAFYSDLFGIAPNPTAMPRVFAPNEIVASLYGTPGTPYRGGTIRIPNTEIAGAEFGDWQGIERHPVRPSLQAPGAAILLLSVRDLDASLETIKKNGGAVVTPGGAAKSFTSANAGPMKGRAVLVTDPDGFFIQLAQLDPLPEAGAAAITNVIGAGLAFTVSNIDATMRYYRDVLGFEAGVPAALYAAGGMSIVPAVLPGAAMKSVATRVPGTAVPVEFLQAPNAAGSAFQPTIRDPGAGMLRLRVRDIDTTFAKLKAAGATVSTANGEPVTFANGQRMVVMRDPNNFFVQPVMAAPPAAPRPQ